MSSKDESKAKTPVPENGDDFEFNPDGMRVLVVEASIVCLKYLVALLQLCNYQVTATTDATEALQELRDEKNKFDIVIVDVIRPDLDGFQLLEIITQETDIPVIMCSADDSRSNIVKGIQHGARDYLVKPLRLLEIKNIWKHVFRKKICNCEKQSVRRKIMDCAQVTPKMKIEDDDEEENDECAGGSLKQKKPRLTWTPELHHKFLQAVNQIGHGVNPKKILHIMDVPGLTRENVASHLQKYRNMLKCKGSITQQLNTKLNRHEENRLGEQSLGKSQCYTSSIDVLIPNLNPFIVDVKSSLLNPCLEKSFQQNPQSSTSSNAMLQGMHNVSLTNPNELSYSPCAKGISSNDQYMRATYGSDSATYPFGPCFNSSSLMLAQAANGAPICALPEHATRANMMQSFSTGQHDGSVDENPNCRRYVTSISSKEQLSEENLRMKSDSQGSNCNFLDDEMYELMNQFTNNGAPVL